MPNQIPILLCQECGQTIATESDTTRLIQYLDLFPIAREAPPPRHPPDQVGPPAPPGPPWIQTAQAAALLGKPCTVDQLARHLCQDAPTCAFAAQCAAQIVGAAADCLRLKDEHKQKQEPRVRGE
jgi:hypothetical protein